eukprot:2871908-Rhodomonas_salina.1
MEEPVVQENQAPEIESVSDRAFLTQAVPPTADDDDNPPELCDSDSYDEQEDPEAAAAHDC